MVGIEPTSTALAMAIVNLFSSGENGHFKDANLGGILCFIVDRKLKSRYFAIPITLLIGTFAYMISTQVSCFSSLSCM